MDFTMNRQRWFYVITLLLVTNVLLAASAIQSIAETPNSTAEVERTYEPYSAVLAESVVINAEDAKSKANVQKVLGLYDELIIKKNPTGAVEKYLRPDYIQHNPLIETGADNLAKFFGMGQEAFPKSRVVVHKVIAQGDYVWVHLNFINLDSNDADDRGIAGVDIFRFDENGKIAEHWDVLQPVVDPAEAANTNTMF